MGQQYILDYLKAQPFRPFRIRTVSGKTYDIRHPEMVKVSRTAIIIFTLLSDDPHVYDHWTGVGLGLIEDVNHLDAPAPT